MGTTITLTAKDGHTFSAYEASPAGTPRGGLVVVQEIFGVNTHMRSVADGYAADGYHVIAPAIFDRAERGVDLGYEKPDADKGVALRAKIPADQTLADIAACVARLQPSGKVGIVGYCWGGSLAWLAASRVPGLACAVGYYGGTIAANLAEKPRCPVMLHFGEKDGGIPLTDVEKIRAATEPAMVQIFTYADAGHAFNREGNQAHHEPSARLARERTSAFLEEHAGMTTLDRGILAGLPVDIILERYANSPGKEIEQGKFASEESSSRLAANAFGAFLHPNEALLPMMPGGANWGWPAEYVQLEELVRFPWSGGRHPCLDVVIQTKTAIIGVESKRYEPFRVKRKSALSDAYWREDAWGPAMKRYEMVRDRLRDDMAGFARLDATQLIKHAFGLRTAARRSKTEKHPVLFYLYAEPLNWHERGPVSLGDIDLHRIEVATFADMVAGDEVEFAACSYQTLLKGWSKSPVPEVRAHAKAVTEHFKP